MLGEFFIAAKDQIDGRLLSDGPSGRHAIVTAKGLSPVEIATLGQILGVGSYDDLFEQCADEHEESESRESGVFAFPSPVADALARRSDLADVAEKWATSEELTMSGWQSADALQVLNELQQLVQTDGAAPVWYWWSLIARRRLGTSSDCL